MKMRINHYSLWPGCVIYWACLIYCIYAVRPVDFQCDTYHIGNLRSGVIAHQNYPFDHNTNRVCIHYINIPSLPSTSGWQICFVFHSFNLTSPSATCYDDYLEFPGNRKYCGAQQLSSESASTLDRWSNIFSRDLCWQLTSQQLSTFTIRFVASDSLHPGTGYYAEYEISEVERTTDCCKTNPSCPYCYHGYANHSCSSCCPCATTVTEAPCKENQFMCFNRRCIQQSEVCDGQDNCQDGSDESYWHARCLDAQNIEACSFEYGSCHFVGTNWTVQPTSPVDLHHDNTFKTDFAGRIFLAEYKPNSFALANYTAVPVVRNMNHCFSFWHYLYRGPIGSLAVYVSTSKSNHTVAWQLNSHNMKSGQTNRPSSQWLQGEIFLAADDFPVTEITFEASGGEHPENKIALDDISFLEGGCRGNDLSCTFELGFCEWDNKFGGWMRVKGRAPSAFTGPDTDASYGGYYIYANSGLGHGAQLVSRPVSRGVTTDPMCFYFQYYIAGSGTENLTVSLINATGHRTQLMVLSSSHGLSQNWLPAVISIPARTGPFQIIFDANGQLDSLSDVALDNLLLTAGDCFQNSYNKPGLCPHVTADMRDTCLVTCSADEMCLDQQKCCVTGCGRRCIDPVALTSPPLFTTRRRRCRPDIEFTCKDLSCINTSLVCDDIYDCLDHSDEGIGCHASAYPPMTGGGLAPLPNHGTGTATVVASTVAIVGAIAFLATLSYCLLQRRRICRRRRLNGGRASDYFDHCDCAAQSPPPPYEFSIATPPPYSPPKTTDKPPEYEVVLLAHGTLCHQPVDPGRASDGSGGAVEGVTPTGSCAVTESSV